MTQPRTEGNVLIVEDLKIEKSIVFKQIPAPSNTQNGESHIFLDEDDGLIKVAKTTGNEEVATSVTASNDVLAKTDEIDLTAIGNTEIVIDGSFNVDEIHVVVTTLNGSITTQPTLSFGIHGSAAKIKAAAITTLLTALGKRQVYSTLLTDDAETTLVVRVTSGAVLNSATAYKAKVFFKGVRS